MSADGKLRNVAEVAAYLGVSRCWVYRHAQRLEPVRVGRLLRFAWEIDPILQSPPASTLEIEESIAPQGKIRFGFRRWQRGSVYRTPNGWRGKWREDVIQADGKLKRKPVHRIIGTIAELPTITAARRRLEEILRGSVAKTEITFRELYERWEKAVGPTLKKPTLKYYVHVAKKNLLPTFGPMQIRAVSRYEVQMFLAEKSAHYGTASLRGMRTTLQKILTWAIDCKWLESNPCTRIKVPRSGKKRVRHVLTPQQILLLASQLEPREAVLVILLAATGLRISEAIGLRWSDVQDDGVHVLQRIYEGDEDEVKTEGSERVIPIDDGVLAILNTLPGRAGWIFRNAAGNPLIPRNTMRRKIKPALRKLGFPNIGYHDFRHTLASLLGQKKESPKVIAEILGHSDVTTTLKIYTHPSVKEMRSALAGVTAQFSPYAGRLGKRTK